MTLLHDHDSYFEAKVMTDKSYFDLTPGSTAKIGIWTATATEESTKDWNYYSKAWHRSHGPKITVTRRAVEFVSERGKKRVVELDGWRGNWQLKALLDAGIVSPKKGQMHIRLNAACDIKIVRKSREYVMYERSVKDEILDYCMVSPLGMTYHGQGWADCLRGLALKRKAIVKRKTAFIDWQYLKNLGFCDSGIKEFCSLFGFDLKDSVSPEAVYAAVKADIDAARPFVPELKTLAEAVGFDAPELHLI